MLPLMFSGPLSQRMTCGLPRQAMDLLQGPYHPLAWQGEVHLNAQCFSVKVINDIAQSEVSAFLQLVMHEVRRPDLIDGQWHAKWFGLLTYQALPRLDAQVELQLSR